MQADERKREQAGLHVGDIILAIDGVPVIDRSHDGLTRGQIGSHVTLRVACDGHLVSQAMEVTMRRGRERKSAAVSAGMPGIKVLGLALAGPKGCLYKVQVEKPGSGEPMTGLMSWDMATDTGGLRMPAEEEEDRLGYGHNGPIISK